MLFLFLFLANNFKEHDGGGNAGVERFHGAGHGDVETVLGDLTSFECGSICFSADEKGDVLIEVCLIDVLTFFHCGDIEG